jgi:hypothetical protein
VSQVYPFRENGNREFRSPDDERSGLSMVEIPKKSWTIQFKEATCHEITHFEKMGIANSEVPVTRDQDFPWWKPRSSCGPSNLRRLRVKRLTISGNRGSRFREPRGQEFGLS